MKTVSRQTLLDFARGYVELWNAGEKEAWIENWRTIGTGEFLMYDPVGTPPKKGFEEVAVSPWDLFQPTLKLHINPDLMYICGNEMCWVMENTFTNEEGESSLLRSVKIFKFDGEGNVEILTYYDVPEADDPVKGDLFSEYLPEDGA